MTTDPNLVLDPVTGSYVLPAPPRGKSLLTVAAEPKTLVPYQAGIAVRALGERFQVTAQSLELLLLEVRERVHQLDQSIAEDTRAQLKGAVREISKVLDWCDAARTEIANDSSKAIAGLEPVDVVDLCNQLSAAHEGLTDPIAVIARHEVTCWADRGQLRHVVQKALALVWERTGGQGLRCLETEWRDSTPTIRVCSRGEPVEGIDPVVVEDFRLAVENAGITVTPDDLGPGGAGLVLRLPA